VLHRFHRIGRPLPFPFDTREGEDRVVVDGELDHLLAMAKGGDPGVELVRGQRGRHEDDAVQVEDLQHFLRATQVAHVDRIEGAAEEAPLHDRTCPFP